MTDQPTAPIIVEPLPSDENTQPILAIGAPTNPVLDMRLQANMCRARAARMNVHNEQWVIQWWYDEAAQWEARADNYMRAAAQRAEG